VVFTGQQLAATVGAHSIGHQQQHFLRPERSPHFQPHASQQQIAPVIPQRRVVEFRTSSSNTRISREIVCALTDSSVKSDTTRPTPRVETLARTLAGSSRPELRG
jgi:hypothetical protein